MAEVVQIETKNSDKYCPAQWVTAATAGNRARALTTLTNTILCTYTATEYGARKGGGRELTAGH